jgi:hypothetical protein
MTTLKKLLLIFFIGLGIHRVVQDLLSWIDPEFMASRDSGYFSVIGFVVLYFVVKYLQARNEITKGETKATN